MHFLKELKDIKLKDADDLSTLPEETVKEIQKLIKTGSENSNEWSNALELVHKAYQLLNVERPRPDMKAAWEQYEINIQYAIEQLAKMYGLNGDWRMTASSLTENFKNDNYEVTLGNQSVIIKNRTPEEIIKMISDNITENSIRIDEKFDEYGNIVLEFFNFGCIKQKEKILIKFLN